MAALKDRLKADLVTAMKAHDEVTKSTLRMALAAIANEEVAGKQARDLTEAEEITVVTREVSKRKDSAEAYLAGNRQELATKELGEAEILQAYLPAPLTDDELAAIVEAAVTEVQAATGAVPGQKQMGLVMKSVTPQVKGRADGAEVARLVRARLG